MKKKRKSLQQLFAEELAKGKSESESLFSVQENISQTIIRSRAKSTKDDCVRRMLLILRVGK